MAIPFHICGNLRKVNPTATQLGSGEARFETYKAVLLIGGRSHFLKLAWAVPSIFPGHLTPMFGARHVFKLQQLLLRWQGSGGRQQRAWGGFGTLGEPPSWESSGSSWAGVIHGNPHALTPLPQPCIPPRGERNLAPKLRPECEPETWPDPHLRIYWIWGYDRGGAVPKPN